MKKKNSVAIRVFVYKNNEEYAIYVPKQCREEKVVDLVLIGEKGKMHYVLIKDFNTFMYDHLLYSGRKHFCFYCLQAFSGEEILKRHIQDYFKINCKERIKMTKKGEYFKFKDFERKIKSTLCRF